MIFWVTLFLGKNKFPQNFREHFVKNGFTAEIHRVRKMENSSGKKYLLSIFRQEQNWVSG
jgi:hypothetical protein